MANVILEGAQGFARSRTSQAPLTARGATATSRSVAPADAAAIQSAGQVISASSVPVAAAAQFAGWAPVRICSLGDAPTVVSVLSSQPLRTATEN